MIFRRVAIRNYRSIVRADLQLGQITVIIGRSDCGKSNVVRALRDWAYNAGGGNFITTGSKITRVAVAVGPSLKVLFQKEQVGTGGKSSYHVENAETGERTTHERIGVHVPVEVSELTGVREVEVDDLKVKIQFSQQAEPWFLLSPQVWSAGKVSRIVGRISGIDALLLASRDLSRMKTAALRESKQLRAQLQDSEVRLRMFDDLDQQGKRVERIESAWESLQQDQQSVDRALTLIRQIADKRRRVTANQERLELVEELVDLADQGYLEDLATLEQAEQIETRLIKLMLRLKQSARKAELAKGRLEGCCDLLAKLAKNEELQCPLCGQGAHKGCRAALARQALAARKAVQ